MGETWFGQLGLELLLTGHEILDRVLRFAYGAVTLLLDATFAEGKALLKAVWSLNVGNGVRVYEVSNKPALDGFHAAGYDDSSLGYLSARVNEVRRQGRAVLVHTYLPELFVRFEAIEVLRLLEAWHRDIRAAQTLEFYLLPRGAFPEAERKLVSLVDGVLQVRIVETESGYSLRFVPSGCCAPEYQLLPFEFRIENGRVLVRWGDRFTDRIAVASEEFRKRVEFLEANKHGLRIVAGGMREELSLQDRLLLSQLIDRNLGESLTVFFDRQRELLEKIAEWQARGIVEVQNSGPVAVPPVKQKIGVKTRSALALPAGLVSKLIAMRGLESHRVPAQAYLVRRKSDEAFYATLFPRETRQVPMSLEAIEEFLQDIATRRVTYDVIEQLGEDPRHSLDLRHVPKIIRMMLSSGYSASAGVRRLRDGTYEIRVEDCPVCHGVHGSRPACQSLTGAIMGNVGMCFKKRSSCQEVQCRSMGAPACVFMLQLLEE